jgi:hypothetical protein
VASVEYRLDGDSWLPYADPLVVDEYPHTVEVRAADIAGNASAVGTLEIPTTLDPAPELVKEPTVRGKTVVGYVLAATPGAWDQDDLAFSYQWLRGGEPIPGATEQLLRLTSEDVGHRLSVRVIAQRAGALPGAAVSEPTAIVTASKDATALWSLDAWS